MDPTPRQDAERPLPPGPGPGEGEVEAGRDREPEESASGTGSGSCPRCRRRPREVSAKGRTLGYCRDCRLALNAEWRAKQKPTLQELEDAIDVVESRPVVKKKSPLVVAKSIAHARQIAVGSGWPPRVHTRPTNDEIEYGDGDDTIDFLDAYGRITKDSVAGPSGEPLNPREWQKRLIRETFARNPRTGRFKHRTAIWGMARKNGKTGLVAPIALAGLTTGGEGAEVYSAAADRAQAKLMLTAAKRTVEMDPELKSRLKLYRDAIEDPVTGSVYRALSADAYTKEGLSPTLVLADELHAWPNRDLYDVLALAMGGRYDAMMLIVTTAGIMTDIHGQETIAYEMYRYGQRVASGEIDDPTFYMAWWAAEQGVDVMDEQGWADANPGLSDILDIEELRSAARRAKMGGFKESEFRIKRLNQWVMGSTVALPGGLFESLSIPQQIHDAEGDEELDDEERDELLETLKAKMTRDSKEPRVVFFDGSFNHDCTALMAVFLDGYMEVVGCWEKDHDDDDWRVPIGEVENTLFKYCGANNVLEVGADPFRWAKEIEDWKAADLPMLEYPTTSPSRMVPAWAIFYDAAIAKLMSHDGDPRLERHIRNMVLKIDRLGPRPVKEHRHSFNSIDLGICAVAGYARAMYYASQDNSPEPLIAWG